MSMPNLSSHTNPRHGSGVRKQSTEDRALRTVKRNGWLTHFFIIFLYLSSAAIYMSRALERQDVFVSTLVIVLSCFCVYLVIKGNPTKEKLPLLVMIIMMLCEEISFIVSNYASIDATLIFTRLFIPISLMYRYTTINDLTYRELME